MSDGWYGPALNDIAHGGDAGSHKGPVTVGVLHTTESPLGKYAPSDSDYGNFGHTNYPHFTCDVKTVKGKRLFVAYQHISIRKSAKALKNRAGGVETNREGAIQFEVVGSATKPFTDDPVMVEGLGHLMRWVESQTDIPRGCGVVFKPYPASYGTSNGVRLTNARWERYAGWLGHQHVPENDHGDPGAVDIAKLLAVGVAAPPPTVVVKPPAPKPPTPAPAPEHKEIDMFIVLDADSPKQFVCDVATKRHISQADRAVLIAAGVPYVGDTVQAPARRELLSHLTEVTPS